jgi:hypothetical protein
MGFLLNEPSVVIGLAVATLAWLLSVIAGHHSMLTRAARATALGGTNRVYSLDFGIFQRPLRDAILENQWGNCTRIFLTHSLRQFWKLAALDTIVVLRSHAPTAAHVAARKAASNAPTHNQRSPVGKPDSLQVTLKTPYMVRDEPDRLVPQSGDTAQTALWAVGRGRCLACGSEQVGLPGRPDPLDTGLWMLGLGHPRWHQSVAALG